MPAGIAIGGREKLWFDSKAAVKPTIIYKKENGARYEHSALAILIKITTEKKRWESSRELSTEQEEP